MEQQPEIIYSLDTMIENRKEVKKIFNELKSKFLTGKFTLQNLIKDYNYSIQSANLIIDTLARNGMLNGEMSVNNTTVFYFVNDKQKQIENIILWKKRSQLELDFFNLAINVIETEITKSETNNLKIV